MKEAAFFEYGPAEAMQYADIPDPAVRPGDLLVRVQACGVNHSDLDSRAGTSRWPFELPMVLGTEFTGTVEAVGGDVGSFRPGDLVTALQQYSCGRCALCARWRPDLCAALEIFGTTRWGGYGELVCVPAGAAIPLEATDDPLIMAAGQCARLARPDDLAASLDLIRQGTITVPIAATFPVSDAAAAHRFLERHQHVGKVLLVAS